jgi:hypothetical protein
MNASANNSDPGFWSEVARTYAFPFVMFALAIIPGLNFTYSGHGGLSWFVTPLCFPWVILRAIASILKGPDASRTRYKRFFLTTIPAYVVLALPLSWAATASLRSTFGLSISTRNFFGIMVSPLPWWYFTGK